MRKVMIVVIVVAVLIAAFGAVKPAKADADLDFSCAWLYAQQPKIYMAGGSFGLTQYDVLPCARANRIQLQIVGDPRADYRVVQGQLTIGVGGQLAITNNNPDPGILGLIASSGLLK